MTTIQNNTIQNNTIQTRKDLLHALYNNPQDLLLIFKPSFDNQSGSFNFHFSNVISVLSTICSEKIQCVLLDYTQCIELCSYLKIKNVINGNFFILMYKKFNTICCAPDMQINYLPYKEELCVHLCNYLYNTPSNKKKTNCRKLSSNLVHSHPYNFSEI